jgi:hypothetical protein
MMILHIGIYVFEVSDSQRGAVVGDEFAQAVLNTSGGGAEDSDQSK